MAIVKNAIQAVVPREIIAIATARNTIPSGRNTLLDPLARPDSGMGVSSPFISLRLRRCARTRNQVLRGPRFSSPPRQRIGISPAVLAANVLSLLAANRIHSGRAKKPQHLADVERFWFQDRIDGSRAVPWRSAAAAATADRGCGGSWCT
jgi:hypothetical protein